MSTFLWLLSGCFILSFDSLLPQNLSLLPSYGLTMAPLSFPSDSQPRQNDLEKGCESGAGDLGPGKALSAEDSRYPGRISLSASTPQEPRYPVLWGKIATWNERIESLAGLEARGITRVLPEERHE